MIYAGSPSRTRVHWAAGSAAAGRWPIFALVIVPGLLFVAAFALTVPLIMPAPLFRVLFVGYWIWGNLVRPDMMPTLARSLIQPVGGYPINALLDHYGVDGDDPAGPVPGATLNFLRPEPTAVTGWLSIASCSRSPPPRSPGARPCAPAGPAEPFLFLPVPSELFETRKPRCGSRSPV